MCLPKYDIELIKEQLEVNRSCLIQSIQRAEFELSLFKKWITETKKTKSK